MGQNPADHFVHEMTHLAHSDVILLVGRPDGRLAGLTAMESSIIMSVQQARFISSSASGGIEAISVGHNPWQKPGLFHHAVDLPTRQRPHFHSEKLLRTGNGGHAPGALMHRVAELAADETEEVDTGRAVNESIWIDLPSLIERLGNRREASRDDAINLVTSLLFEQQERLQIDAAKIDVEALFNASGLKANPNGGDEGGSNKTGGKLRRSMSTLSATASSTPSLKRSLSSSLGGFSAFLSPVKALNTGKYSAFKDGDCVSVNKLMALLRGHNMRVQISLLHKAELRAIAVRARARQWLLGFSNMAVSTVFAAWLEIHEKERAVQKKPSENFGDEGWQERKMWSTVASMTRGDVGQMAPQNPAALDLVEPPNGQWRKLEELRRNGMKIVKNFGFSCGKCFNEWKQLARAQAAARGKRRPVAAKSEVVASGLVNAVQGEKLLAEFTLVESLYETRIAAAERLLAFFVMLHHAVQPTSRLPFWRYSLDRSESRLRVASTPAPVGFVETLPKGPVGNDELEVEVAGPLTSEALPKVTPGNDEVELAGTLASVDLVETLPKGPVGKVELAKTEEAAAESRLRGVSSARAPVGFVWALPKEPNSEGEVQMVRIEEEEAESRLQEAFAAEPVNVERPPEGPVGNMDFVQAATVDLDTLLKESVGKVDLASLKNAADGRLRIAFTQQPADLGETLPKGPPGTADLAKTKADSKFQVNTHWDL